MSETNQAPDTPNAPRTARQRARAELTAEILASARSQLAEVGPAALSLRAVSRDLGMASSALYRYFPSRDALLTALIIEAYDALGEACETAEAAVDRADHLGRWRATCHAARDWARENQHEYALIYGTPVPGYAAPDDTIASATRVPVILITLLIEIDASGAPGPPVSAPISKALSRQVRAMAEATGPVHEQRALVGVGAWAQLFGLISFELFGSFVNTFDDAGPLFDHQVNLMAASVGMR